MAVDDIAGRLVKEVVQSGLTRYAVKFVHPSGRQFRVIVEEDQTIRKDMNEGMDKLGHRISAGPSGSPCGCCGGSGRG